MKSHSNQEYNKALIWLSLSGYDVNPELLSDKKTIRIDLIHNGKVVKSEKVMNSLDFPAYLQNKIITLYNHFNKNNENSKMQHDQRRVEVT